MPMHDWTRVEAGFFHAFHSGWITVISNSLNNGGLPEDYYALAEQVAAGFGPDVVTLQSPAADVGGGVAAAPRVLKPRPVTTAAAQTDAEFYRRKKNSIAVRHVSDDRVVAMIEIVSPGNKASRDAIRAFREKACELLEHRIHLLIADVFPPGKRDPGGVHALIWGEVTDEAYTPPLDKPLMLAAYECELVTRAYLEPFAVGDDLPDMPLFLEPNGCVMVPLEATYREAFEPMPKQLKRRLIG